MGNTTQIQAAAWNGTSTLGLAGPRSVPATELLTVALRSFLEQTEKEFTWHF